MSGHINKSIEYLAKMEKTHAETVHSKISEHGG